MDSIRYLYIFRHGETDWNAQQRFQGHIDIPLNETGRRQAAQLITPLKRVRAQAILTSDLGRAHETARIIAEELTIPVFSDAGLREANLGKAQGLTRDEIARAFGEELVARWKSHLVTDADISYPGGESGTVVLGRVMGALNRFIESYEFQRIGISTHGGVIRRLVRHLIGENDELVPIPNGILYTVVFNPSKHEWEFQRFTLL